jgi:hypothetical protein
MGMIGSEAAVLVARQSARRPVATAYGPLLKCLKLLRISAFWGGPEGPGGGSIRRE